MNPKTVQKLMSDVAEMKEFISFLSQEAIKLNNLEDIKLENPIEIAVEVKARKKAFEKIMDILSPLVNTQEIQSNSLREYVA